VSGEGDPAVRLREHLVETAASLLAERRASAITTRDIARAAGVSDGVLYNYFADKNELIVAGLVRRFEAVVATFEGDLPEPGAGSLADGLLAYAQAFYERSRDSFPMIAGLVTEPELLARVVDEIHRPGQGILPFLSRIGEYLYGEQQLGRIRGDVDLPATLMMLTGSCATLTMRSHLMLGARAVTHGERIDDAEANAALRRVVDLLLTGIAPAP
jgi:AcrR family transcriptional regulator